MKDPDFPIPRANVVNLDSIESVSVGVLVERIGTLSGARMEQICAALAVATDCGWAEVGSALFRRDTSSQAQ